ncbi:hypothetical protein quinque_010267 [Culex quinquefasciatus]
MSAKLVTNWRFPSGSFYPCSLYSVGNEDKTVFIVPGDRDVYTLVVKNLTENIRSCGSPHNVTNIKLADASLVQIVALVDHTVGLKESGELVGFPSSRECRTLEGTSGVRAICAVEGGTKLALMRLLEEDRLQLEVVDDVSGPRIGSSTRTFDLSWEKSGFPISRKQQSCTIRTVLVRAESLKFFQRLLNCKDLAEGTELILFTLDNGLYWIKLDGESYEVVAVKLFPVNIRDFNFASCTSCFSTLLDNNVLNVCSISVEPENLLIQESNICLGHCVEAHEFVSELGLLVYSNGSQLVQLKYYFSELIKTIEKESKEFSLAGVVALTFLDHDKLVISITENRLIYSTPITSTNDRTNLQKNDYFELTDEVLSQAKQMTCLLTNEAELNRKTVQQVGEEKTKIEILSSVSNQSYFKNFVNAHLRFNRKMPTFSSDVLLLGEVSGDIRLMAEVQFTFKNDFQRILNLQKQWTIVVAIDAKVHHIQLDAFNSDCNSIRLLYPLSEQYFIQKGLPTIIVSLVRLVHHARDCLSLQIPIKLQSNDDFADLLEFGRAQPLNKLAAGRKDLHDTIRSLINLNERRPLQTTASIEYRLKMPPSVRSLATFLTRAGFAVLETVNESTVQVYLSLGGAEVEVRWDATGSEICLKSCSPAILKLVKTASFRVQSKDGVSMDKLKTIQLRLTQSDQRSENVISLYRQLRSSTSNT